MERLVLREYARSGNCYKIRLTAAHVGAALERREYDIMQGETRTPEFLAKANANGRIPVLQVGDRFLPESNAACWYLASDTLLMPEDRFEQADIVLYAYTHVCEQGGYRLADYPAVVAWLDRVASRPGHVALD